MSEWARGFDLNLLKQLAGIFKKEFKPHSYGAFGIPKERDVANALAVGELAFTSELCSVAVFKQMASSSKHVDFSETIEATIRKGDLFIKAIAGPRKTYIIEKLTMRSGASAVWVEAHVEEEETVRLLQALGFVKILTKVSASSDLKGLFFRGSSAITREGLAPEQRPGLKELHPEILNSFERDAIWDELIGYEETKPWEQHYSSYNKRQSWTAFALRGFDVKNPGFIIKPAEMSKQWKAENPDRLSARCDWTPAAKHFDRTIDLIREKIPCDLQRVRLMRLSASGGELTRHADITDPEAGVKDGQISRLHIPLQTAPGCEFRSWDLEGKEHRKHFHECGLFYLDTRKPHAVQNNSSSTRIHLVIDVYANAWLRELLNA